MIDVIVICNERNCNQCFILCTFQIIFHNVLTDQKVHWTKFQSFHPALCTSINLLYEITTLSVFLSCCRREWFLLYLKLLRMMHWIWPLVVTQDHDLCEISKHFYVWFNFAQSFWIVFQLPNEMPFHLIWKRKIISK